ncbi:unnamed protein product [Didymodactylos carnosus]|uniref:N-acetyltransferase domain-containing protein n=1 Tax=Didymodactylos carnosus TaxID=1234261 RepID=A0A815WKK0_9BILA|nr:unnamed protein product [Didymodactylos carnosus]CAF1542042.1 unnamed protein product [Didymodactylos carnosus]CAF4007977.1 unnamed protein product [Didymodactylos carnosus]CAF4402501.1 unnamed protein product [Didymodactylos carnosus]
MDSVKENVIPTVIIRPVRSVPSELEQCKPLIRTLWLDQRFPQNFLDRVIKAGDTELYHVEEKYLKSPRNHWWVAQLNDNKIVGQVSLQPMSSGGGGDSTRFYKNIDPQDYCELRHLTVLPEYQRQQIGYRLLKASIEFARQNKYKALYVKTMLSMKRACEFYERCGFERAPQIERHELADTKKIKLFNNIDRLTEDDWNELKNLAETEVKHYYDQSYFMKL